MGLLTGLCIGPLPALLRLLTDRRPCIIIYNSLFCCERVQRPGESLKALGRKQSNCDRRHWHVSVALSVGQPGAPVSSKDCAQGSFSPFVDQRLTRWESGVFFWISYCFLVFACGLFCVFGFLAGTAYWTAYRSTTPVPELLFRNDDILKCPEQFCSLYSLRTCFLERYTATALVLWQMQ